MTRSPTYTADAGMIVSVASGDRYSVSEAWERLVGHMTARKASVGESLRSIHRSIAHDLIDAIADAEGVGS